MSNPSCTRMNILHEITHKKKRKRYWRRLVGREAPCLSGGRGENINRPNESGRGHPLQSTQTHTQNGRVHDLRA